MDGCSSAFESGKQIIDKIRIMGFNKSPMATILEIGCTNCDVVFQMEY